MEAITRGTIIAEIIDSLPEANDVFTRMGMGCLGCMGALEETVESGARMHGIDVERLLAELNQVVQATKR